MHVGYKVTNHFRCIGLISHDQFRIKCEQTIIHEKQHVAGNVLVHKISEQYGNYVDQSQ